LKRDVLLFANSIGCTSDELHFLYVRTFHTYSLVYCDLHTINRSSIPTLQSSQPIRLYCVSVPQTTSPLPNETFFLTPCSLQDQQEGSYRLLCRSEGHQDPRRTRVRRATSRRRPATNPIPQTPPHHLRRQEIRDPDQGSRRLRQGKARHSRRDPVGPR
jgi:hypothetical protein